MGYESIMLVGGFGKLDLLYGTKHSGPSAWGERW